MLRPRSHRLEDLSRNRLHEAFNGVGWTVEDLRKDYGEDLLVRIFEQGIATPLAFFVQAKATDRIEECTSTDGTSILLRVNKRHIRHWEQFWEPVILTVWDSKADRTYWECIQTYTSTAEGKTALAGERKTVRIGIPRGNVLDALGLRRIFSRTKSRFKRFEQEREGTLALVTTLERELRLKIEYNPQREILSVARPGEAPIYTVFGKLAEKAREIAGALNCTLEESLNRAVSEVRLLCEAMSPEERHQFIDSVRAMLEAEEHGEDPEDLLPCVPKGDTEKPL